MGGAALTLVFSARDSTRDIDAVFRPKEDMQKIISSIAAEKKLPSDWLNDTVKPFVTDKLNFDSYLQYSNLTVSVIDAESLLAMKLTSARHGTKDMDDCLFLMQRLGITTEKALFDVLDKYIVPYLRNPRVKHFTKEVYMTFLKADKT